MTTGTKKTKQDIEENKERENRQKQGPTGTNKPK
jgi:hypothetical protein